MGRVSFLHSPIHKIQSERYRNVAYGRANKNGGVSPLIVKVKKRRRSNSSQNSSPQVSKRLVKVLAKTKNQKKRVIRGRITRLRTKRRRVQACGGEEKISAEILKELESDPAHYKVMRKRWQNSGIPDPTKNLTSLEVQGKRVKFEAKENEKLYPCTSFHDEKISKLQNELKKTVVALTEKENKEISVLVKKHANDLNHVTKGYLTLNNVNSILPIFEEHLNSVEETFNEYSLRKKNIESAKLDEINKVESVRNEIHTFNLFYNRQNTDGINTMCMSEEEYKTLHDVERWFTEISKFYN